MLASYSSKNGETSDTAGVIGMTMLQQRILSFNLYKLFVNKNTYDDLLFQVKQVTANAVGLNAAVESLPKGMEPPHPSVAAGTSSFNWARVADKGIGGGIAGAVIGGIAALFGLLRKRKKKSDAGS